MLRLFFVNDHDVVSPNAESVYSNISITEETAAGTAQRKGRENRLITADSNHSSAGSQHIATQSHQFTTDSGDNSRWANWARTVVNSADAQPQAHATDSHGHHANFPTTESAKPGSSWEQWSASEWMPSDPFSQVSSQQGGHVRDLIFAQYDGSLR